MILNTFSCYCYLVRCTVWSIEIIRTKTYYSAIKFLFNSLHELVMSILKLFRIFRFYIPYMMSFEIISIFPTQNSSRIRCTPLLNRIIHFCPKCLPLFGSSPWNQSVPNSQSQTIRLVIPSSAPFQIHCKRTTPPVSFTSSIAFS